MAVTREDVETVLVSRCGKFLELVGLDDDQPNAALSDPIVWALRMLGFSPASPTTVVDADMTTVAASHYDALFDLAELRTLENIQGNLTLVTHTTGPVSENLSDLGKLLLTLIPSIRANVAAMHGGKLAVPLGKDDRKVASFRSL